MERWLKIRPIAAAKSNLASDLVFIGFNGKPRTTRQQSDTAKAIATFNGLNPKHYSSHSIRSGAATDAVNAGFSIPAVAQMGDWKDPESAAKYFGLTIERLRVAKSHIVSAKSNGA